jgi:hypothetical protein
LTEQGENIFPKSAKIQQKESNLICYFIYIHNKTAMDEVLKSTLLDFEKSFFYINLLKSSKGKQYVVVEQTLAGNYKKQRIKISYSDLSHLVKVLNDYANPQLKSSVAIAKESLSAEKENEIINIYLKGVSIKNVALTFGCSVKVVEGILKKKDVVILDQEAGKTPPRRTANK